MSAYALFQMSSSRRQSVIGKHLFYVEQAQKRLLSQFHNIESEADRAAEEWLEQSERLFDPDRDDPHHFYEAANDVQAEFYELLSDMREQTRLSVVAGMFHQWDKQLRDWLTSEVQHWCDDDKAIMKTIWLDDFGKIAESLESLGWNVRGPDHYRTLDACRLVVNVYKHGQGKSLDELKSKFPEYLDDPSKASGRFFSGKNYREHTNLKVSDEQLQAFSEAIVAFWKDVPENVFDNR